MPVYILHLDKPVMGAQHYIGYASNLTRRIQEHHRGVTGKTSKMMLLATSMGVTFQHVNTLATGDLRLDRKLETQLHTLPDAKIAQMYCPTCIKARMGK